MRHIYLKKYLCLSEIQTSLGILLLFVKSGNPVPGGPDTKTQNL